MNQKPFNEVLADELDKRADEIKQSVIDYSVNAPWGSFIIVNNVIFNLRSNADKLRKLSKEVK